jgi:hypothetical protein
LRAPARPRQRAACWASGRHLRLLPDGLGLGGAQRAFPDERQAEGGEHGDRRGYGEHRANAQLAGDEPAERGAERQGPKDSSR